MGPRVPAVRATGGRGGRGGAGRAGPGGMSAAGRLRREVRSPAGANPICYGTRPRAPIAGRGSLVSRDPGTQRARIAEICAGTAIQAMRD